MQLKNGIAKVALRFDLFKNQIALIALRFIAFKKFCAFLHCASVYSEKMPTSVKMYLLLRHSVCFDCSFVSLCSLRSR